MPTVRTTRRAKLRKAETMDIIRLRQQLRRYEDHYSNTDTPLVPDEVYDNLRRKLEKLSPDDPALKKIGSAVRTGKKVTLPFPMYSLDKIYPDRGADKWLAAAGTITASDKLDGVSAEHALINGEEKLYTRGNGTIGQDISALIPKIALGTPRKGEAVRVELLIPKGSFSKNWANKFSNPRNTVSGIVNSGDPKSPVLKDVLAVAHGMLNPKRTLAASAAYMKARGYTVVPRKTFINPTIDELQAYYDKRRAASKFELDGLVLETPEGEQIAFKVNSEAKEATVKTVEWTLSKNKILIPVVILSRSISLSGVNVTRATAHNARFVKDMGIGPGAIVYITRAGDVIPKIVGVKAPVKPDLPKNAKWDANKTHLIGTPRTQEEKNSVYTKRLSESLRILGVPQIREGLVSKLVEAGYNTILKLFKADDTDFQGAGLGPTQADILYTGLRTAKRNATHTTMMWASGVFPHGMGSSRFEAINAHIPYDKMRFMSDRALYRQILAIPGFSDITANQFVAGFNKYVNFITKLRWRPKVVKRIQDDTLKNITVVFTGFRDKAIEAVIRSRGGKIGGAVNKNTTVLVVKDKLKLTSVKAIRAATLGVKVMTVDKFAAAYGIQLSENV